ncbi:MAG TPA: GNAT family N-acetyltransferase [Polyangiaceae bacterium]|nr:GNAT family N-acetyltransferase [Polyangiaceae bacterium]
MPEAVFTIRIRPAQPQDLPRLGQLAGALVRLHHDTDPARFFLVDQVEEGYAWWFGRELKRAEAVILVAVRDDAVVGYAYGTIEERDWNLLLDAHGALHDVFVAVEARKLGVGHALVKAIVAALEERGAPRVLLSTMVQNEVAQRVFHDCGFRPTMLEMTRGRDPR